MKKIVILTGAGISAESGLKTFRDSDGLWEGYRIEDVATPEAWQKNPTLVQQFYNERRKAVLAAKPNAAHLSLVDLESKFKVNIITQNVDDLHEKAGSTHVLHLHGVITLAQSNVDPTLTYAINGWELNETDRCEHGQQLRPHVVWFGEGVPNWSLATRICAEADFMIVIGTSLKVYPAANLIDYAPKTARKYIIDLDAPIVENEFVIVQQAASKGVPELVSMLLA
ncbi:MAG: Sir2 family NAD-dependent protein deacetylase [Bacteroidota bacterium]